MKIRFSFVFMISAMLLTACNNSSPSIIPTSIGQQVIPIALASLNKYETGVAMPVWSHDAYTDYGDSLDEMRKATGARWVELPIVMQQSSDTSSHVEVSASQVSPQSLEEGIKSAHINGLRVFVVPLLNVNVVNSWAGTVMPGDITAWFNSYWQAFRPYVHAAIEAHADQLGMGTELDWIQENASSDLWKKLISSISSSYHGRLTYDSNWSEIGYSIPSWMRDHRLNYIGVSTYVDLTTTPSFIAPNQIPELWRHVVQTQLDQFSSTINKPVIISEIGYRDRSDALYHTWSTTSTATKSQEEQTGAYAATLTDIQGDAHIAGFFPWAWQNVGDMSIDGSQAVKVIKHYYKMF